VSKDTLKHSNKLRNNILLQHVELLQIASQKNP